MPQPRSPTHIAVIEPAPPVMLPAPRPVRTVWRDRREPMDIETANNSLATECAWEPPPTDASLRERWAAIAPELAGHIAAVSYDPDSG
ncbi:hypothetical protein [Streptomyces nitrosporeus]|uniref:hypothetical protein n=1 Tax=Streptomyces nitrosporeus TaxID=28894 RepID=UPI00399F7304